MSFNKKKGQRNTNQPCFALENVLVLGFDIQVQMCDRWMKGTAETTCKAGAICKLGDSLKGSISTLWPQEEQDEQQQSIHNLLLKGFNVCF